MTGPETSLPPELEAFIERRRVKRRLPAEARARVLARAGSPDAAGAQAPRASLHHRGDSPVSMRARWSTRIAVAASLALAAGTVWGFVRLPQRPAGEVRPVAAPAAPAAARHAGASAPAPAIAPAPPTVAEAPPHRPRAAMPRDPFAVELALLQRAQTAYTHRDLTGALGLLAEHARQFPNGRLAEEREALRVRSLLAAGRHREAHRVAAAFAAQFPRSALLRRLETEENARP